MFDCVVSVVTVELGSKHVRQRHLQAQFNQNSNLNMSIKNIGKKQALKEDLFGRHKEVRRTVQVKSRLPLILYIYIPPSDGGRG